MSHNNRWLLSVALWVNCGAALPQALAADLRALGSPSQAAAEDAIARLAANIPEIAGDQLALEERQDRVEAMLRHSATRIGHQSDLRRILAKGKLDRLDQQLLGYLSMLPGLDFAEVLNGAHFRFSDDGALYHILSQQLRVHPRSSSHYAKATRDGFSAAPGVRQLGLRRGPSAGKWFHRHDEALFSEVLFGVVVKDGRRYTFMQTERHNSDLIYAPASTITHAIFDYARHKLSGGRQIGAHGTSRNSEKLGSALTLSRDATEEIRAVAAELECH